MQALHDHLGAEGEGGEDDEEEEVKEVKQISQVGFWFWEVGLMKVHFLQVQEEVIVGNENRRKGFLGFIRVCCWWREGKANEALIIRPEIAIQNWIAAFAVLTATLLCATCLWFVQFCLIELVVSSKLSVV